MLDVQSAIQSSTSNSVYEPFIHQDIQVPDMSITTGEIEKVLKVFDVNKVGSPDNISMFFFLNLSLTFSILFNKSLDENKFPSK